jgi:hypothetical protein
MFMIVSDFGAVPFDESCEWHSPGPMAYGRCDVADADSTPLRLKVYSRAFMVGKIRSAKMRATGKTGLFTYKGLFIRSK